MAEQRGLHGAGEAHPWADLTPEAVLKQLTYELYAPVSVLGSQVDRLHAGEFDDEELVEILQILRDNTNQLGKLVVALKRYTEA